MTTMPKIWVRCCAECGRVWPRHYDDCARLKAELVQQTINEARDADTRAALAKAGVTP